MSSNSSVRPPIGALLVGALVGAGFAYLAYTRISGMPRSPGDWLWNGPISVSDERRPLGGPALDALFGWLEISDVDIARQRMLAPIAALLALLALVLRLGKRKAQPLTAICVLAALGLAPLALRDPAEVRNQALLLALPICIVAQLVPLPAWLMGLASGFGLPLVAGHELQNQLEGIWLFGPFGARGSAALLVGTALLSAGCALQRDRKRGSAIASGGPHLVGALAGCALLALEPNHVESESWLDAAANCRALLDATGLPLGLLAASLGITLLVYTRNLGMILAIGTAAVAMFLAGSAVGPMRARAKTLERDTALLKEYSLSVPFRVAPHILLNIPLHVRPLIHTNAHASEQSATHDDVFTPDLGGSIHIPESWTFDDSRIVLRWTQKGIEKTLWRHILDLPPIPSHVVLRPDRELGELAATPADWRRLGTLTSSLRDVIDVTKSSLEVKAEYGQRRSAFRITSNAQTRLLVLVDQNERSAVDPRSREFGFPSIYRALRWNGYKASMPVRRVGGCFWIFDVDAGETEISATCPKFFR